jgi:hypothetical protein
MEKEHPLWCRFVLGLFGQTIIVNKRWVKNCVQLEPSQLSDVTSGQQTFKMEASVSKGLFCPFFPIDNTDDADHFTFRISMDSLDGFY